MVGESWDVFKLLKNTLVASCVKIQGGRATTPLFLLPGLVA